MPSFLETFTQDMDMDKVLDSYCTRSVSSDYDEYVGPWDTTGPAVYSGYCTVSRCRTEACFRPTRNEAGTEYVWTRENLPMQLEETRGDEANDIGYVCNTRHNGQDVRCTDDIAPSACATIPRTCHAFDAQARIYTSDTYDYMLDSLGECVYRPVDDIDGTPILANQCRTSTATYPPALELSNCSDGSTISQTYDERGQPEWTTECPVCDPVEFRCERFVRDGSPLGGEWSCETPTKGFGRVGDPDFGTCAYRYSDGTIYSSDECFDNGCCYFGTLCSSSGGGMYHGLHRRGDIDRVRTTIPKFVEDEDAPDRYRKRFFDYVPEYILPDGAKSPMGIRLVNTADSRDTIDVTNLDVDDLTRLRCEDGTEDNGRNECLLCDPSDEYFKKYSAQGTCAKLTGCTAKGTVYDPTIMEQYTTLTSFEHEYLTQDNVPTSCVRCPVNTIMPTRSAGSTTALRTECYPCGDEGDRNFVTSSGTCASCPHSMKLREDAVTGQRTCESCPVCPGSCDGAAVIGTMDGCKKVCPVGTHGGGLHNGTAYPRCYEYCGEGERFNSSDCVPCSAGTYRLESEHSEPECDACDDNSYREFGSSTMGCQTCPSHPYISDGISYNPVGSTLDTSKGFMSDCFIPCTSSGKAFYSTVLGRYMVEDSCPHMFDSTQCTEHSKLVAVDSPGSPGTLGKVSEVRVYKKRNNMTLNDCAFTDEDASHELFTTVVDEMTAMNETVDPVEHLQIIASDDGNRHICGINTVATADGCECADGTEALPTDVFRSTRFEPIDHICAINSFAADIMSPAAGVSSMATKSAQAAGASSMATKSAASTAISASANIITTFADTVSQQIDSDITTLSMAELDQRAHYVANERDYNTPMCPPDFIATDDRPDLCAHASTDAMNFVEARTYCEARNSFIALPRNKHEYDTIFGPSYAGYDVTGTNSYWLGVTDQNMDNSWTSELGASVDLFGDDDTHQVPWGVSINKRVYFPTNAFVEKASSTNNVLLKTSHTANHRTICTVERNIESAPTTGNDNNPQHLHNGAIVEIPITRFMYVEYGDTANGITHRAVFRFIINRNHINFPNLVIGLYPKTADPAPKSIKRIGDVALREIRDAFENVSSSASSAKISALSDDFVAFGMLQSGRSDPTNGTIQNRLRFVLSGGRMTSAVERAPLPSSEEMFVILDELSGDDGVRVRMTLSYDESADDVVVAQTLPSAELSGLSLVFQGVAGYYTSLDHIQLMTDNKRFVLNVSNTALSTPTLYDTNTSAPPEFTLSGWVYVKALDTTKEVPLFFAGTKQSVWLSYESALRFLIRMYPSGAPHDVIVRVPYDSWLMITIVADKDGAYMRCYVNDTYVGGGPDYSWTSAKAWASSFLQTTNPDYAWSTTGFGVNDSSAKPVVDAEVSNFALWNQPLSEDQVHALFDRGRGWSANDALHKKFGGLLSYWSFDNTLRDTNGSSDFTMTRGNESFVVKRGDEDVNNWVEIVNN